MKRKFTNFTVGVGHSRRQCEEQNPLVIVVKPKPTSKTKRLSIFKAKKSKKFQFQPADMEFSEEERSEQMKVQKKHDVFNKEGETEEADLQMFENDESIQKQPEDIATEVHAAPQTYSLLGHPNQLKRSKSEGTAKTELRSCRRYSFAETFVSIPLHPPIANVKARKSPSGWHSTMFPLALPLCESSSVRRFSGHRDAMVTRHSPKWYEHRLAHLRSDQLREKPGIRRLRQQLVSASLSSWESDPGLAYHKVLALAMAQFEELKVARLQTSLNLSL